MPHEVLFPQILPHVWKYLDHDYHEFHNLLSLRLVSHKWKEGVDTLIESKPNEFPVGQSSYYCFKEADRICRFLETFQGHHPYPSSSSAPFIGKSVKLILRDDDGDGEYERVNMDSLVLCLMLKFGAQLRRLEIEDRIEANSLSDNILTRVSNIVQHAPNLEWLKIDFQATKPISHLVIWELEDNGQLPLPLPHLKSLVLPWRSTPMSGTSLRIREAINNVLLRMCSRPDTLSEVEIENAPPVLTSFSALESLSLGVTMRQGVLELKNANWPALSHLAWTHKTTEISLEETFGLIHHFRHSLKSLKFLNQENSIALMMEYVEHLRLDLPRLKSLEISGLPPTLNFVVALSELEVLRVSGWSGSPSSSLSERGEPEEEIIKTGGIECNMFRSNIWELLPCLQTFHFSGKCGRRRRKRHFHNVYSRISLMKYGPKK